MFFIGFTSASRTDADGRPYADGALTLGEHTEGFQADLTTWSMRDYERQWRDAIARLLAGSPSTALITSNRGSGAVYHEIWPVWREGATAHLQRRLVLTDQLTAPFTPDRAFELVGERETIDAEGRSIPEWAVPLGQLATFLLDR